MADNKHILVVGPTASGKSVLAHNLALKTGYPIVSADSRQVYKYLDIGTAKPPFHYLNEVTYYNISILDPKQTDNAQEFKKRFDHWEKQQATPLIVVGGSTLYQQVLLWGFNDIPTVSDSIIQELNLELKQKGIQWLYRELLQVDPIYAKKMDGFNTQRIIRALSVYRQTGNPFSSYHNQHFDAPKNWHVVYPVVERELLKKRIAQRIEEMFQNGLQKEITSLLKMGYTFDDPGLSSIGYQEWRNQSLLEKSINMLKEDIYLNTWHYAKRQITWLKRWEFLHKYEVSEQNLYAVTNKIFDDYSAFQQE